MGNTSLARILFELPTERLRSITRSRAATIRGVPRIEDKLDLARFLASALSNFDSVRSAIKETTLSEYRTLAFLSSREREVPFDELLQVAGSERRFDEREVEILLAAFRKIDVQQRDKRQPHQ